MCLNLMVYVDSRLIVFVLVLVAVEVATYCLRFPRSDYEILKRRRRGAGPLRSMGALERHGWWDSADYGAVHLVTTSFVRC